MKNLKQLLKLYFPFIFRLLKKWKRNYYNYLGRKNPQKLIEILYYNAYGKNINWNNPKDIDEKVNYLKLFSDTTLWSELSDKYEVRNYVKKCGLNNTLNEIYGIYNNPDEINFDELPKSFVIKTTNGGGGNSVLIVKDKTEIDVNEVRKKLNKWLKVKMGYFYGENHYDRIMPRLIIEKYLQPEKDSKSLVDYKFNCFNGKVYSVFLCSEREFGKNVYYSVYDLDWNLYPEKMLPKYRTDKIYECPKSFKKMIEYSSILSKNIPYVRIDWYEIDGNPIFGEMTFTPAGGFQSFYSQDYLLELGDLMDISNKM